MTFGSVVFIQKVISGINTDTTLKKKPFVLAPNLVWVRKQWSVSEISSYPFCRPWLTLGCSSKMGANALLRRPEYKIVQSTEIMAKESRPLAKLKTKKKVSLDGKEMIKDKNVECEG